MNLITAEHLTHSYTERVLFENAAFSLNEKEKVGIIGINGTGKSTLLKILAGKETPDNGTITTGRNLRIAYLPQTPSFHDKETTLTAALPPDSEIAVSSDAYEPDAKSYLTKLGFTDFNQQVLELSGGQRKRVALVRTLLTPCDVLILDEPTNHLDSAMSEWLEDFLKSWRSALIMITHDRYFLDSVVNRIVEIDKGSLYSYSCSYLEYLERKAEREEIAQATERKRQSILRKEIAWIQRGARARSTKQKAHIARYEKLRDMSAPKTDQTIEITAGSSRLGNTTIELEHLCKSFDGKPLLSDFSYIFLHTDRVGIIGPNGCGKSTLFKMITGKEQPDSGTVTIGQTVKIGYFTQESEPIDPSVRVIDFIKEGGNIIHTSEGTLSASVMLERFLFPPDMQYALVERLSGGERRRLSLLRILMEAPNILLLDEPTNDLDITTLTLLEDYLDSFHGIVVTVSHDRYFLDRICNRIFAFEGNGILTQYEGGYTDYKNASSVEMKLTDCGLSGSSPSSETPEKTTNRHNWKDGQEKKKKMSYKEQREFETIEDDIASLEEQIEKLDSEILQAAHDFVHLNELTVKKDQCQSLLNEKMERWMYLEELNEEITSKLIH